MSLPLVPKRGHLPSRFVDSGKRRRARARRALGNGEGPAARLWGLVPDLHMYSLHSDHLDLPADLASPALIYDHEAVAIWRQAIRMELRPPLWYRLEVGRERRLHAHVLAGERAGLLGLPRTGEIIKPVDNLESLLAYLQKPAVPASPEALLEFEIAMEKLHEQGQRPPRLSRYVGLPGLRDWHSG